MPAVRRETHADDRPLTLTREQLYRLIEAWVAPELWKERKREIDILFDAAEDGARTHEEADA